MRWMAAVLAVASSHALAAENDDLDLIPGTVEEAPAATGAAGFRFFIEDAASLASFRGGLAVPFPSFAPHWRNRTSFDGDGRWSLGATLTATLSDRFNVLEQGGGAFSPRRDLRNDLREAYLSWEPAERAYLEAGRINLRNGAALGFNPTDFFKARSGVQQASLDPSALRRNRLGAAMLRGQAIWDGGSASVSYAPRLTDPAALSDPGRNGFDPRLDRTNAGNRLLVTVNQDFADLAPQAMLYHGGGEWRLGLNVSGQLGSSVIAYGEWAGGWQRTLIAEAVRFGKETGTLPAAAPILPPTSDARGFRSDAALGAAWSSAAKVTVNLEYHFHQAGLSRQDWRNWFALGEAQPASAGALWFVRGYAADQQRPLTRHQAFLRADWTDALVPRLGLTALAFVNLYDGSSLAQLSANYPLNDAWTLDAYVSANLGGRRSERGSMPQAATATLQLRRYF